MNERSLSRIFRSQAQAGDLAEIEALLALAHGGRPADAERVLAQIARSPLNGDLLRFARDLEPASAALSAEFASTLRGSPAGHRGVTANRTMHGAARRWRIGVAVAASLLAAVAVWNGQREERAPSVAPIAHTATPPDRIFANLDDRTSLRRGDEIFRAEFHADKIFSWNEHDG